METQKNKILVVDFGGQSTHLILRRVKKLGFDAEIVNSDYKKKISDDIAGIILSGGARSVYDKNAPKFDKEILFCQLPILGICYGHQLIAHLLGGKVQKGAVGEYGPSILDITKSQLFTNLPKSILVWMNHRDSVSSLPKGFEVIGKTKTTKIAAYENRSSKIYAVQFHPEVSHTRLGEKIIRNFLSQISSTTRPAEIPIQTYVEQAKLAMGNDKAIIGLSGGLDSSVAAILVAKAMDKNLLAVYVDTGFMRTGETLQIKKTFSKFPLRLKTVNASKLFYTKLKCVTDPEQKRKIIGKLFIDVFSKEAKRFGAKYLIQGTIYSDRIESGITKHSSKIKSHHNVGGLPKNMKLKVYEPLKDLYKDEVRLLAKKMKLPSEISNRQVFPGPGFAIRIIGSLTPEKIAIVRKADTIIQEEIRKLKFFKKIYMAFPVLLSIKSVGIQGDERVYKYPLVLRVIQSEDVITSNFAKVPYDILQSISSRITNEIREVSRVVYDISNKPPATMEWE